MNRITKEHAEKLIRQTNGAIFGVSFVKANGSLREMNCRLGVAKNLKGKGMGYDPRDFDMLTVWDMQKNAYRMVKLDTVLRVTVSGDTYAVI